MPTIHAAWLIASALVPVALAWRYRARLAGGRDVAWRAVSGIGAALVILLIPLIAFACACGAGNNPIRQAVVPSVGALVAVSLIGPARLRLLVAAGLFAAALGLGWQFNHLVLPPAGAPCRFTGDPAFVRNSCAEDVTVGEAWYTPLTGLHPLTLVRTPRTDARFP